MNWNNRICTLNLTDRAEPAVSVCPIRERLAQAFSRLQDFQVIRSQWQDPHLEKAVEERIIWRELLELELEDLDEQIERIEAAVGNRSE